MSSLRLGITNETVGKLLKFVEGEAGEGLVVGGRQLVGPGALEIDFRVVPVDVTDGAPGGRAGVAGVGEILGIRGEGLAGRGQFGQGCWW